MVARGSTLAQADPAAVLGCGADAASTYRAAGLTTVYLGDEAILELDQFSLEGRAMRIARQSLSRRFPIRSLYRFNKKFTPSWQPHYLVAKTAEDLAAVSLACLRAEGLLKHSAWAVRSR